MCDARFHRVLLWPAAVDTITADVFAAFKSLEYVIIIINTIVIILMTRGGDVEPPTPSIWDLHSTDAQHGVRDNLPAVSTGYYTGDNVDAFSQELVSFLRPPSNYVSMPACAGVSSARCLVRPRKYVSAVYDCITGIPKSCGKPTGGVVVGYEVGPFDAEDAMLTSHMRCF